MIVIGITGTLGAGKGSVVKYLVENKGYLHFSVREFLADVILTSKETVNRDSLTHTANKLRAIYGPAYITDQLFKRASATGKNCIIESIRTPGEIVSLRKEKGFILLAVDADIHTRYQRIIQRGSETDQVSLDTFKSNEQREMHARDPNKQNLSACISMADYIIMNNGSIADLEQSVDAFLKSFNLNQTS